MSLKPTVENGECGATTYGLQVKIYVGLRMDIVELQPTASR